jgi:tRNA pseudouridine55 synthase
MDSIDRVWLINKPLNWTSFDVVNKLRFRLKMKKIGHAGTLDPLATGLLIVCTGKMCKQIDTFMGLEKEYTGTFTLGQTTASYDLETEPSPPQSVIHLTTASIVQATQSFIGEIQQIPPAHSAIRINGTRAYKLARKGKEAALPPRNVSIRSFDITHVSLPQVHFRVSCSKGTYIRSLAHDFGQSLGVGAYLSALCRTRIGTYRLEDALTVDQVEP